MLKSKDKTKRAQVTTYTPTDILDKSSKLSGDWLEKETRKNFPDLFKNGDQTNDKEDSTSGN